MTNRRPLSPMRRAAIFRDNGGRCHLCERLIRVGELWDVSHDRPLALGGEDAGDNLKVAHRDCHATQTKVDIASITKSKRVAAKHVGAFAGSKRPFPGGKKDKWRKRINGRVELR